MARVNTKTDFRNTLVFRSLASLVDFPSPANQLPNKETFSYENSRVGYRSLRICALLTPRLKTEIPAAFLEIPFGIHSIIWFLSFLLAAVFVQSAGAAISPQIVNPQNGHRYVLLERGTWLNSEQGAILEGGHLVTI